MKIETSSYKETYMLGTRFGANISSRARRGGLIFTLDGELGSGKTAFVSGLAHGLGVSGPVLSPSFTIVREYSGEGGWTLYHIDLYRLSGPSDLMSFDFYEYVGAGNFVTAIEWAAKFGDTDYLPVIPTVGIKITRHIEKYEKHRTFEFKFLNIDARSKKEITAGIRQR